MFLKIENLLVASLDNVLFHLAKNKGADQTGECAGCFAPVLYANPRRQVFSCGGPYVVD